MDQYELRRTHDDILETTPEETLPHSFGPDAPEKED